MASYKDMLSGFATLASKITGLAPPGVVGNRMPPKAIDPRIKGRLEFHVIGDRSVSTTLDDLRYEFDAGLNKLRTFSVGFRVLTIQVKFVGYDQTPKQSALFYLERLGDRLNWPAAQAALRAVDMGIAHRGSFVDLSQVISAEDRIACIGVKDFMFNCVVSEEVGAIGDGVNDSPIGWVETLDFTSDTLDGPDGNPIHQQVSGTVQRPP